jgi:branched-chain amino acid transport system permease protein
MTAELPAAAAAAGGGLAGRALAAAALLLLVSVPWWAGAYVVLSLTAALALGIFALSYDLVLGVTGLISVSHATLFGVGGYGLGVAMTRLGAPFWPAAAVGVAAAAVLAWVIGSFSVRTTGPGFIILTVIFAHALENIANVWTTVTGGENGIVLATARIPLGPGVGVSFAPGSAAAYYTVVACLVLALLACRALVASPFGLTLRAIRGNELRALALGYRTGRYKIAVNVLAGALAAVGGVLYALSQGFVSVDAVGVVLSIEVIVWTILGGPGTLIGPVVAAVLMSLGTEYLRSVTDQYVFAIGGVTLLVVLFLPRGLAGLVGRRAGAREARS